MNMPRIGMLLACALCAASLSVGPAAADAPTPIDPLSSWRALPESALAQQNGRQGISIANFASTDAFLANNSVSGENVQTGSNSIADQAFSSMSGVGSVLMNSGNNVIMNNVTIVNLTLH